MYPSQQNTIKHHKKGHLSYEDFLRIRNYKLQNSSTETIERIKRISQEAFRLAEKDNIKEAIEKLKELEGVRIPIASTILAMKYPDKFAIIDRRVITELGKEEWLEDYTDNVDIYEKYLELLKSKSKKLKLDLRECEIRLFEQNQRKK